MSHILHMSDFHLGKNWREETKRLTELAKWINDKKIKIKYLVYTGDITDAQTVREECLSLIIKKYSDEFSDFKKDDVQKNRSCLRRESRQLEKTVLKNIIRYCCKMPKNKLIMRFRSLRAFWIK